jgi:hypothetical protein
VARIAATAANAAWRLRPAGTATGPALARFQPEHAATMGILADPVRKASMTHPRPPRPSPGGPGSSQHPDRPHPRSRLFEVAHHIRRGGVGPMDESVHQAGFRGGRRARHQYLGRDSQRLDLAVGEQPSLWLSWSRCLRPGLSCGGRGRRTRVPNHAGGRPTRGGSRPASCRSGVRTGACPWPRGSGPGE